MYACVCSCICTGSVLDKSPGDITEVEQCGSLLATRWANRAIYEGRRAVKDTQTPPLGGLTADTWPWQTQTPGPGAKKDQKVSGKPGDLKLRGSLTTLISDLLDCLHHLLPLVTDKTKPQDARACFTWITETPLKSYSAPLWLELNLYVVYVVHSVHGPGSFWEEAVTPSPWSISTVGSEGRPLIRLHNSHMNKHKKPS